MKQMNISVDIDVTNLDHVEALNVFMAALGNREVEQSRTPVETSKKGSTKKKPEPEIVEEQEDDFLGEEEEEITPAMLRDLTAPLSEDHRDKIKAKLAEYGVRNVSTIPKDKYGDYHKFITSL